MEEIWKNIPGYEGIYEASNLGRIRTHKNKITFTEKHGRRRWKQRILKQKTDKNGYKRVELWKDGQHKTRIVHQLVAITFLPNRENKPLINHKDCNPSNNHIDNLEWATYSENLIHAYVNGLNKEAVRIMLVNKNNGKEKTFLSMSQASRFLGKGHGYISSACKKGKKEVEDYQIYKIESD
ncbi:MAG: NUMOD4 motif-containing HNH endonuclease [Tetragenococcus koreensis]|nr:NUMOD4 motif-containing HNH endonuclease [Tetragenococcus koreensis]